MVEEIENKGGVEVWCDTMPYSWGDEDPNPGSPSERAIMILCYVARASTVLASSAMRHNHEHEEEG